MSEYAEPRFNGYVGIPAAWRLDEFARYVQPIFNEYVYLVGSALKTKDWHDLDVRVTLDDIQWERWGFGEPPERHRNGKWVGLCLALSTLGEQMIGCKVDFQVSQKSFDEKHCKGPKERIGLPLKQ